MIKSTVKGGIFWLHHHSDNKTYHRMSAKHLERYVNEFSGRHNVHESDTIDQMNTVASKFGGKRLFYRGLVL